MWRCGHSEWCKCRFPSNVGKTLYLSQLTRWRQLDCKRMSQGRIWVHYATQQFARVSCESTTIHNCALVRQKIVWTDCSQLRATWLHLARHNPQRRSWTLRGRFPITQACRRCSESLWPYAFRMVCMMQCRYPWCRASADASSIPLHWFCERTICSILHTIVVVRDHWPHSL